MAMDAPTRLVVLEYIEDAELAGLLGISSIELNAELVQ